MFGQFVRRLIACLATMVSLALVAIGPAQAQDKFAACKPIETAAFGNRVHVMCETPVDGRFPYFAVSTADPRNASRMLALIAGAQLGDKFLSVLFDPSDTSATTFGCNANNCRNIKALIVLERVPGRCEFDGTQRGCAGFCAAIGNRDRACPGYCAAVGNNTDPICPAFCPSHDDFRCPGNCVRHPDNPACDICNGPQASHNPQCQP